MTMSETRFYHVVSKGNLERFNSLEEVLAAARRGGFIWLDYWQPTQEELSLLVEPLGLHPLSIEDCVDANEVPKIEDFPGNTFIVFNAFDHTDNTLSVDEIDLFSGKNFLVTVSGHDAQTRRPLAGIERLVERDIENARQGPAFLMHLILDFVVDQKFTAIDGLEDQLDDAQGSMMRNPAAFHPGELLSLRRDLLTLRKSLFHEREILVKICRRDCPFIPEKAVFRYRDVYDHLAKFLELTETYREILTSLMELHMSMLNNQMTRAANRTNNTVSRLTLITTVFMPLTLLASVGGMSEWSMMTGPENWRIAYPVFMVGMAAIGLVSYYLMRRVNR